MEQINIQELDRKIFSDLIHDPSSITAADSKVLTELIEKYPYTQLLRSFYARSLVDSPEIAFEKELAKAALFSSDGAILQTIIEDPQSIKSKTHEPEFSDQQNPEVFDAVTALDETPEADIAIGESDIESEAEVIAPEDLDEPTSGPAHSIEDESDNRISEETVVADRAEDEIGNILASEPENPAFNAPTANEELTVEEKQENRDQDLAGNLIDNLVANDESITAKASDEQDDLDLLIKQNVASADFLGQERDSGDILDQTEDIFTPEVDIAENITHNAVIEDQHKISRYDDDKMPYSFLWWLSKTRKEHADNYQPYVSFQLDTSQNIKRNTVDQLSTQIIENIFHLQSPVDDLENAPKTVPFQVKRKEDFIVEKFIREEPQIKPPNSEKLDNENKARKSAEDPNDLVSETLAHIYTDQMLFHKAIETYKKLSLKFPEKSTYFADQIRELEKKIN